MDAQRNPLRKNVTQTKNTKFPPKKNEYTWTEFQHGKKNPLETLRLVP